MFKCNYLDKLKDKTFQKIMISDQKHKCEKKGPSSVQTASPTKELRSKRVCTKFHSNCFNHSYRDVQRSSIDLKENLLHSLILNLV